MTAQQALPVFKVPHHPGTSVLRGGLAAALVGASTLPRLDLRDLPRPPAHVQETPRPAP